MRASTLLLLAAFIAVPTGARADTYTATFCGSGVTAIFPNVGGDEIGGMYFPSVSELYSAPLYVYINGGPRTQGGLTFYLVPNPHANLAPPVNDYLALVISLPITVNGVNLFGLDLYGSNIVTSPPFPSQSAFYIAPGTYNYAAADGTPYSLAVTDDSLPVRSGAALPRPRRLAPRLSSCSLIGASPSFRVLAS